MTGFDQWCDSEESEQLSKGRVGFLQSTDESAGISLVAEHLPQQYAATTTLAEIASRLGKDMVAAFLDSKIPESQRARSGDLGEILASAYVEEELAYVVGPSRLIHRDHKEWAMRGDDVLGARFSTPDPGSGGAPTVEIIKVEAKSRKKTPETTIASARQGLEREKGLPSAHSLTHFAERLLLNGDDDLGEAILEVSLMTGLRPDMIRHLMFVFTGNDPRQFMRDDLDAYAGPIDQQAVVLNVEDHQNFIRAVFSIATSADA